MALLTVQSLALAFYSGAWEVWSIYATAGLFGITVGNLLMMQPLLMAEAFGLLAYARIFSLSQMMMTLGYAFGPAGMGALYEWAGGYQAPYLFIAGSSLVALTLIWAAGPVDQTRLDTPKPRP